jgi:stage V sporulation protein S
MTKLKVSSTSKVGKVAGAISHYIEEEKKIEIAAIGAGAVNQSIKAIAAARGHLAVKGIDIYCIPGFSTITDTGEERTAIKLIVGTRGEIYNDRI